MFIAHAPAGYLITRPLIKLLRIKGINYNWWLALGIFSSVLPDLDLLYFYLIDNRQHVHHSYWTHTPIYWLGIYTFVLIFSLLCRLKTLAKAFTIMTANVLTHFFLDTVTGHIRWSLPFSNHSSVFFDVSARYDWWVWNYVWHWTFLFELSIVAMTVFALRHKKPNYAEIQMGYRIR